MHGTVTAKMEILDWNGSIARRVGDNEHSDSENNGSFNVPFYNKKYPVLWIFLFFTGKITLRGKVSEYATRFASFTFEFGKLMSVTLTWYVYRIFNYLCFFFREINRYIFSFLLILKVLVNGGRSCKFSVIFILFFLFIYLFIYLFTSFYQHFSLIINLFIK